MPRTEYARLSDLEHGRRLEDGNEVRAFAERSHRKRQMKTFVSPLTIWPPPISSSGILDDAKRPLHWQYMGDSGYTHKTLETMKPEEIRMLCFKDCALYTVGTSGSRFAWKMELFDKIYWYWFPGRSPDTDISHWSFFCHLMCFRSVRRASEAMSTEESTEVHSATELTSIAEVLSFHKTLCARAGDLVSTISDPYPNPPHSLQWRTLDRPSAVYKLRPTFEKCFLIIETKYSERCMNGLLRRGVIIVWLSAQDATKHRCMVDPARGITSIEDAEDLGGALAFRCATLELAMGLVLATDPERYIPRRERHGHYKDVILDSAIVPPMSECKNPGCCAEEE